MIEIGGISFPNKKDLLAHVREILYRHPPGYVVDRDGHLFLEDLIRKRHRWAAEKIGCGIARFRIVIVPTWRTRGFLIERTDGTQTDFSFTECVNRPKDWTLHDVVAACRRAVATDVMKFKDDYFRADIDHRCAITGDPITRTNCHVDHVVAFRDIVRTWLNERNLKVSAIRITGYGDGEVEKRIADESLMQDFLAFHRERARLRMVTREANLGRSRHEEAAHD